jgi:hypothetical protein
VFTSQQLCHIPHFLSSKVTKHFYKILVRSNVEIDVNNSHKHNSIFNYIARWDAINNKYMFQPSCGHHQVVHSEVDS